tara:strand:- start:1871 stop:2059 length:189 start_codon:yes stop_codon:yes gene_type:complete
MTKTGTTWLLLIVSAAPQNAQGMFSNLTTRYGLCLSRHFTFRKATSKPNDSDMFETLGLSCF